MADAPSPLSVTPAPATKTRKRKGQWGGKRVNSGGARKGAGRPKFQLRSKRNITTVKMMLDAGYLAHDIGRCIEGPDGEPVGEDTVKLHFAREVASHKENTVGEIAKRLVWQAKKGNVIAQIFYLKTQGRFRETHQVTTPPGEPAQSTVKLDATPEMIEAITKAVVSKL